MSKIQHKELQARLSEGVHFQLVDVRSPGEYAAGHIPGAINVPMDQIEARLADVHPTRPVVLVCQSGDRAEMTMGLLEGRLSAQVLEGGTKAWADAGNPVVSSTRSRWSLERQVRLMAGLLVFVGIALSLALHPGWLALSGFVSLGLMFAGLTDLCPMASAFSCMPWNKSCSVKGQREAA